MEDTTLHCIIVTNPVPRMSYNIKAYRWLLSSVRDTQQTWDFDGLTLEPKFSTLLQTVSV